jgi:hypothetical protein
MAFSDNGKRLFAAAGVVVRFPSKHVSGINPTNATLLGLAAGGIGGAFVANDINNNLPVIAERIANAQAATLQAKLDRQTALRVWDVEKGRLTTEVRDVFFTHPNGLADAFFDPSGAGVATLGETSAHAWDLSTATPVGPLYDVREPNQLRRAKEALLRDLGNPSLIQRIDFTPDGQHALVLVRGDRDIRIVRRPGAAAGELTRDAHTR